MPILTPRDEAAVRKEFERIAGPVKLMREVAGLSDQITVEVLNLAIDRARAEAYGVDQVPAIVVEGSRDWGIRFYGIPLGYEFSNLIDSIIVASTVCHSPADLLALTRGGAHAYRDMWPCFSGGWPYPARTCIS